MYKSFSKKIVSFIVVFAMLFSAMPANVIVYGALHDYTDDVPPPVPWYAGEASYIMPEEFDLVNISTGNTVDLQSQALSATRYTILALDISSSTPIGDGTGNIVFTINTALEYVRAAAIAFVDQVQFAMGTNYVAVVVYGGGEQARVLSPFTRDFDTLRSAIADIRTLGGGRSVAAGLDTVYSLLAGIQNPDAVKNVILFTSGKTDSGAHSYVGRYDRNTVGSRWNNSVTGIPLFAYANVAYVAARNVDRLASIYTVGLFQNLDNIASGWHDIVQFLRLCAEDWASSSDHFFDVEDPNDIRFVFGEIGNEIFPDPIPIIVIPGVAGSNLRDAVSDDTLWLSVWDALPSIPIVPDPELRIPRLTLDAMGSSVNNVSVGQAYGVSDHPISGLPINMILPYRNMMRDLRAAFPDRPVHFFGYDWRACNARTALALYAFIDSRGYQKVDIVAHSMGGLVAAHFIAGGNGDKIHNLITIGTPYLGSPKAPYVFLTGNLVGILPRRSDHAMRAVASHMPSAYQLLPFQMPSNQPSYLAIFMANQPWIPVNNTHEFMQNPNTFSMIDINGRSVPRHVREFFFQWSTGAMNNLFLSDDRHVIQTVNYYVITGDARPTIRTTALNRTGEYVYTLEFYRGDGTVPLWSASIGGRVEPTLFPYDHLNLMFMPNVIAHVIGVLNHNVPPGTGAPPSHPGTTVVRIASPVETTIRLGDEALSSKEAYFNRVTSFGSLHFVGRDGNVELFALNADEIYDVLIVGTGYGTMTYSIRFYDADGNFVEERIFFNVPITYDTVITTNTNQAEITRLYVDTNGDGTYDIILYPTVPPEFDLYIFDSGDGGYPSEPDPGFAASGIIRMWAQRDGANAPVYLSATNTIVALDQDGNCAMDFIQVNRIWEADEDWLDHFNYIDVIRNQSWQYINFSMTAYRQTVELLLDNTNYVPVADITVTPQTLDLVVGDAPAVLTAQISPVDATNQAVTWISGDTAIATVINGVVTAAAPGATTITVTTAGSDLYVVVTVTVTYPQCCVYCQDCNCDECQNEGCPECQPPVYDCNECQDEGCPVCQPPSYDCDECQDEGCPVCDTDTVPPLTTLSAPANLSIAGTTLGWGNVPNNSGYRIYVNGTAVGTAVTTSFNLASLNLDTGVHTIQVRTLGDGASFLDSAQSLVVNFVVQAPTQPPNVPVSPLPPTPPLPAPLLPGTPADMLPALPMLPLVQRQPSQQEEPTQYAYALYEETDDSPPVEAVPLPLPMPPRSIPTQLNRLLFTIGSTEYVFNNNVRTSVGAPFIAPSTDRMMIPLRTLSEALGVNAEWHSATRSAHIFLSTDTGALIIPADDMLPGGMGSVIIVEDRIFIPLRFVMYALDAAVEWDSPNSMAIISWQ